MLVRAHSVYDEISSAPCQEDVPAKKKRKTKAKQRRRLAQASPLHEDRRSEVVTVAWMLTIVATLGAEVVGGISLLLTADWNAVESRSPLPSLMLFIAVVTGFICLLLTPLVHRFRRTPPPVLIQYVAVTASVLPILVAIMTSLR